MPRKESSNVPASAQAQQEAVSEGIENFELPRALVTKIAKSAIPENTKLQKDTVLSLVKGSTVFINYLAATAHDVAHSKQHKSISASDVLKALEMIEFADLVPPLQAELQLYRDNLKGKKGNAGTASASATISIPPFVPNGGSVVSKSRPTARKGKERAETVVEDTRIPPGAASISAPPAMEYEDANGTSQPPFTVPYTRILTLSSPTDQEMPETEALAAGVGEEEAEVDYNTEDEENDVIDGDDEDDAGEEDLADEDIEMDRLEDDPVNDVEE